MSKPQAVIFDRDGTLASVKYVAPKTRDGEAWRQYNAALPFDAPVPNIVALARDCAFKWNYKIIVVSGRMEGDYPGDRRRRMQMYGWLDKHEIPYDVLLMREGGDTRRDSIVKREMYEQIIEQLYQVVAVVDDRPEVIQMWLSKGLNVIAVTDPDILPPIASQHETHR